MAGITNFKKRKYNPNTKPIYSMNRYKKGNVQKFNTYKNKNVQQNLIGKTSMKEIKCRDQVFATTAISTGVISGLSYVEPTVAGAGLATGYTCLNCLTQGIGASQRIGNKVVIKSLRITGTIVANPAATSADNGNIRIVIFYDKQTNEAAPAYTEVLADIQTDLSYNSHYESKMKIANKKRFVVLRDKVIPINYGDNGSCHIDWFIKKDLEVEYSSTAAPPTVANINTGAIFMFIFGNATYSNQPQYRYVHARIRFED